MNPPLGVWLASAHGVGLAHVTFSGKDAGASARRGGGNGGFPRAVATRATLHFPCGGVDVAPASVDVGRRDGAWPCELPSTLPSWSYSTSSTQPLAVHESPPRADFPDGWPSLLRSRSRGMPEWMLPHDSGGASDGVRHPASMAAARPATQAIANPVARRWDGAGRCMALRKGGGVTRPPPRDFRCRMGPSFSRRRGRPSTGRCGSCGGRAPSRPCGPGRGTSGDQTPWAWWRTPREWRPSWPGAGRCRC